MVAGRRSRQERWLKEELGDESADLPRREMRNLSSLPETKWAFYLPFAQPRKLLASAEAGRGNGVRVAAREESYATFSRTN